MHVSLRRNISETSCAQQVSAMFLKGETTHFSGTFYLSVHNCGGARYCDANVFQSSALTYTATRDLLLLALIRPDIV